jgi:hypothetical protein
LLQLYIFPIHPRTFETGQSTFGLAQPTFGLAQPTFGLAQPTFGLAQPTFGLWVTLPLNTNRTFFVNKLRL